MEKSEHEHNLVAGVITNCNLIYVRKEPKPRAELMGYVGCLTTVMVDLRESTDKWYKISTNFGLEGFCERQYISC